MSASFGTVCVTCAPLDSQAAVSRLVSVPSLAIINTFGLLRTITERGVESFSG